MDFVYILSFHYPYLLECLSIQKRQWRQKREPSWLPALSQGDGLSSGLLLEHILAYAAKRANEIIRQICKRYTRCEIIIRIAFRFVVNPATNSANPNFNDSASLSLRYLPIEILIILMKRENVFSSLRCQKHEHPEEFHKY